MLQIKNLSFAVDSDGQKKEILKNISLELHDGSL